MQHAQELWWQQSQSDLTVFRQLRRAGVHECHLLHYLQMLTEKLGKAYFWRAGHAPPKTHVGLVRFLKALLDRPKADLHRIARVLGFERVDDLERWVAGAQALAYSLQNIAPAEAGHGPNPEYPWPHDSPRDCPATYRFALWRQIADTGRGRKFIQVIERAVERFHEFR